MVDEHEDADCVSAEEEVGGQFEAVFFSAGAQVNETYVLAEHFHAKNLYFWDDHSLLGVAAPVNIVTELLAGLDFAEDFVFDVGETEDGDFSEFEGEFKCFLHVLCLYYNK